MNELVVICHLSLDLVGFLLSVLVNGVWRVSGTKMLLKVLAQLLGLKVCLALLSSIEDLIVVKVVTLPQCTLSMKGIRAAFLTAIDAKSYLDSANNTRFFAFSWIDPINFNRSF